MVKLRVAVWPNTPPFDPWTTKCFINLPEKPCPKPGYELEPFLAIMTLLGWSYEWVVANDSGIILEDGTATGALGMVQRGEADVAANVLRITEERMKIVEFSAPATAKIYQAVMAGMLAVPLTEKVPFATIKELVELIRQGKWHLIYPSPGQLPDCSGQDCGDLERALLKNPIKIVPFGEEFYDKRNYGKCVYFGEQLGEIAEHQFSLILDEWALCGRGIIIRDDSLVAAPGGYFFSKKSKYRRKFDEKISTLFGGIETMVRSYDGMTPYPKADLEQQAARVSLGLLHFYELFVITIGAYFTCCVIFVLELFFNWKSRPGSISYLKEFLLEM